MKLRLRWAVCLFVVTACSRSELASTAADASTSIAKTSTPATPSAHPTSVLPVSGDTPGNAVDVDAAALLREFDANALRARSKYTGKWILTFAKTGAATTMPGSKKRVVYFTAIDGAPGSIQCTFMDTDDSVLALDKNRPAMVSGLVTEESGAIVRLDPCSAQQSPDEAGALETLAAWRTAIAK